MNEEKNYDITFNDEENAKNVVPDDVVIPGNIIDTNDDIIGNDLGDNQEESDVEGPVIINSNEYEDTEEISGPIIVNSEEEENKTIEKVKVEEPSTFKELENEIRNLINEKGEIDRDIKSLSRRKDELEILIKSKQDQLEYKKEVEVTTDKLKTYIRDLEVKPGAVRDALATLINNMDS